MIEKITIKNFKSLKDVSINTLPLNLLAGLNGMGKSSLIQTILLLKQSQSLVYSGQLNLKGWLVDIGKGKDALYQFAEEDKIVFSFELSENKKIGWTFSYKPEWEILEPVNAGKTEALRDILNGFQYLSADRIGPLSMHEVSHPNVANKMFGTRGEYVVNYLHSVGRRNKIDKRMKHKETEELILINQVNGWLSEISPGIKLNIVEVQSIDKLLLNYEFELGEGRTTPYRPGNVGFGISYVLSVIVALLTAEKDNIIIIENPEAHIHPRGQSELGKLMSLCASCGAQLFIETHSDHIINGIRVAVKNGIIDNDKVKFSWFTKKTTKTEQYTEIKEIHIDKNGELSEYPKDFLDEWNNQLLKLV
jgi:predicted ATPase